MSLLDQVQNDTKDAMRAGDRERVGALRLIANELQKAHKDGTGDQADEVAGAVARELPGVSAPTVYATLELLAGLGLARRVTVAPGAVLYDPRTDDHHHAVCDRCGAVEDVSSTVETGAAMRAARKQGFAPARAELVVAGLCRACCADAHA